MVGVYFAVNHLLAAAEQEEIKRSPENGQSQGHILVVTVLLCFKSLDSELNLPPF